jgi:hypothetical protein
MTQVIMASSIRNSATQKIQLWRTASSEDYSSMAPSMFRR